MKAKKKEQGVTASEGGENKPAEESVPAKPQLNKEQLTMVQSCRGAKGSYIYFWPVVKVTHEGSIDCSGYSIQTCKETTVGNVIRLFQGRRVVPKSHYIMMLFSKGQNFEMTFSFLKKFETKFGFKQPTTAVSLNEETNDVYLFKVAQKWLRSPQSYYAFLTICRLSRLVAVDKTLEQNLKELEERKAGSSNDEIQYNILQEFFEKFAEKGIDRYFNLDFEKYWFTRFDISELHLPVGALGICELMKDIMLLRQDLPLSRDEFFKTKMIAAMSNEFKEDFKIADPKVAEPKMA